MNRRPTSYWICCTLALLAALLLAARPLHAQTAPAVEALQAQAEALALENARAPDGLRVEVEVGRLDPRLKLAPCAQTEPYLPAGFKPWGKTRVGLRCLQGPVRWNVTLPLTVKVYGKALVTAAPLPAGSVLSAADLAEAEVDLAAESAPALTDAAQVLGRTLARSMNPGETLRQPHVRPRQWFAAGQTVRLVAVGRGFEVHAEGQAMSPGLEGSTVRVRTEGGRIVTGLAVGDRRVEVNL
jgi:flagella basal body P-ring formation protein FlgA